MNRVILYVFFTLAASLKLIFVSQLLLTELSKGAILVSVGFSMVLFSAMYLFKKYWIWYGISAASGISLYTWASYLYMVYFQAPFSTYITLQASNLSGMSESIFNQLAWWQFAFFFDVMLVMGFLVYMRRQKNSLEVHRNFKVLGLITILAVLLVSLKPASMYLNDMGNLLLKKYTSTSYIGNYGIVGHQVIDFLEFTTSQQELELSAEEIDDIHNFLSSNENISKREEPLLEAGIFEGKNLLLIQFESLQQFVLGAKVNDQEITPNLNKWLGSSISFNHYYPQTAEGNSSDAELLVLNSIYPLKEGSTFFRYPVAEYPSLAKHFSSLGYTTTAFHGDEGSFWNRDLVYPSMGFERYYDITDFQNVKTNEIGMGLSDQTFFEQTADTIKNQKEPYFSMLITLTSHTPFHIPEDKKLLDTGELKGTQLGNYFESIHYTDRHLGAFLNNLKENGELENTVVAIYGDHNGIFKESKSEVERWRKEEITDESWKLTYTPVPFIMIDTSLSESGVVSDVMGQVDTTPTLLDWFGFSPDTYESYALGHNMNRYVNKDVFLLRGDYGESIVIGNDGRISEYEPVHSETLEISERLIKSNFLVNHY
ncbi:LTA synthase family protein [Halobacillus sp. MO56]